MAGDSGLHPTVLAAKEQLARGREKFRRQHAAGSPGVQVCQVMSDLVTDVVTNLWQTAVEELSAAAERDMLPRVALVAHSGFGRSEMAPYSDVDVMLLHSYHTDQPVYSFSRRFSQFLYDTGLDIGYSVRPLGQMANLMGTDATIFTSLTEGRLLRGSETLYRNFEQTLRRQCRVNCDHLFYLVEQSRREERLKYGETVYLLQPNLKRSRGGLREIQLLRWIGFLRYGMRTPDELAEAGHLMHEDAVRLRDSREFLLQLRNELHFHADRAQDLLDRTDQIRLAALRNYPPVQGLHPVEQFMQEYFEHTSNVRDIVTNFRDSARPLSFWQRYVEPLVSHQMEGDYRVGPTAVAASRRGLKKLQQGDISEILRLLDLANLHDKRVEHATWETIRRSMADQAPPSAHAELPPLIAERFLELLSQPARLGELLRRLHALRVLEQIIPAVSHARGLLQFNDYHKYTVDEHSIRVVEALTGLLVDQGSAGEVYRQLRHKRTVHLAALIHDLGKGFPEDHSELGKRIAEELAVRLRLPEQEGETLAFLVHKHLLMSHTAQRHDINDDKVAVQFARVVGSVQNLQMLFVLTCSDLAAVGPGVLNDWKLQLLTDLYNHTLHILTSDSPETGSLLRIQKRREDLRKAAAGKDDQAWWEEQIEELPVGCLFGQAVPELVEELDKLRRLPHRTAIAWGRYLPERRVVEYTIGTYEEITAGIFYKLTGALSSQRQQILSAEIHTLPGGMVLDHFFVEDPDHQGPTPPERIDEICQKLVAALKEETDKAPVFRRVWQDKSRSVNPQMKVLPIQVVFDNSTAQEATIISVFTYDRMGLLYRITRTLFDLGLSISVAKIGTHLDQVVDVFYVVDREGRKIEDDERLEEIRGQLTAAIESLEAEGDAVK